MASEAGADTRRLCAPGALEKFHLGLATDGMACALVFIDERRWSTTVARVIQIRMMTRDTLNTAQAASAC